MYKILIKNGTVIDGTGDPMFRADVAINDGKIVKVGDLSHERGETEIDAYDHYVTPGFIDISNRSDVYWRLFEDPTMESLLHQGITSIIGGNSGASLAPIYNEQMFLSTQKWADVGGTNVSWQKMNEFLDIIDEKGLSMHFGTFVGHGTLRRGLVGDEMRKLTSKELTQLVTQIHEAMENGALGVSLGLIYTHGHSATEDELIAVAETVRAQNGLLAVHLRDEDSDLVGSIEEIIRIAERTKVRVHITHLKAVGQQHWPRMSEALKILDDGQINGLDITFDVYPYTVTGSVLYTFLPRWLTEGGRTMMLGRLTNKNSREQAIKEMRESKISFKDAVVSVAPHAVQLRGRTLGDIARERETKVEALIMDLLLASEGRVIILLEALSEENVVRALDSPYSVITSNSPGYTLDKTDTAQAWSHPRSFGAFPRLFSRYVRERKVLSWELAVHKSTLKVAKRLGLTGRGTIREGSAADVVVLDPQAIRDIASKEKPRAYAQGVRYVVVGGEITIMRGDVMDVRAGKVIRGKVK